jgi:AcrR family transcriptional regulator
MREDHAQERIDQIVDAVIRCIADNGYENLTMQSISEYSGLSRGAINHYFKKKEDILKTVLKAVDQKLFKKVDDRIRSSSDVKDYMRYRLSVTFELAKEDPAFIYVLTDFFALAANNPAHDKGIKDFLKKYRYLSGAGLKPGLKNGKYREVNAISIGAIVVALTIGIGIQWILDKNSFDYEEVAKMAENMVMSYLRKNKG